MKHLLLTTIAAVLMVGCGEAQPPEPPDISIVDAAIDGNIEAVKQAIADAADVNAKPGGITPLHWAAWRGRKEIVELLIANGADVNAKEIGGDTPLDDVLLDKETADLLRKHGGKTGEELKAEGN